MLVSCGGGSGNENGNVSTTGGGGNTLQASIGSAGGAITSMDGNVTLNVPAGALSSDEMISITPISAADLGDEFSDTNIDIAYELEPTGLQFTVPVSIALDVGDDTPEAINLPILLTSSNGQLELLRELTTSADIQNGTVVTTGLLDHFSPLVVTSGDGIERALFRVAINGLPESATKDQLYPLEISVSSPSVEFDGEGPTYGYPTVESSFFRPVDSVLGATYSVFLSEEIDSQFYRSIIEHKCEEISDTTRYSSIVRIELDSLSIGIPAIPTRYSHRIKFIDELPCIESVIPQEEVIQVSCSPTDNPEDSFQFIQSDINGFWTVLDQNGNLTIQLPNGTQLSGSVEAGGNANASGTGTFSLFETGASYTGAISPGVVNGSLEIGPPLGSPTDFVIASCRNQ
jgi:hypothetical protein